MTSSWTKLLGSCAAAFVCVSALDATPAASAPNPNPGVIPLQAHSHGKTYVEWSIEWWRIMMGTPLPQNPLEVGGDCQIGLEGKVLLMAGSLGGTVSRTCTVRPGTSLFFPIFNVLSAVPEDAPPGPNAVQDLININSGIVDNVTDLFATIDGVPLQDLEHYRVPTPPFSFTGASPNPFSTIGCSAMQHCYEGFRFPAVADGFWIFHTPLPPGTHTISFGATFDGLPPFLTNYTLIVQP